MLRLSGYNTVNAGADCTCHHDCIFVVLVFNGDGILTVDAECVDKLKNSISTWYQVPLRDIKRIPVLQFVKREFVIKCLFEESPNMKYKNKSLIFRLLMFVTVFLCRRKGPHTWL